MRPSWASPWPMMSPSERPTLDKTQLPSGGTVDRRVRALLLVVAAVQAVLAVLWIFQVPLATGLWPFPGRTPLSDIFIGSIILAAAGSTGWCLWVRSDRAVAGVALDYLAIFVPFAIFSFAQVAGGAGTDVFVFGVACVAGALVGLGLLRWSLGHPWRDPRPTPPLVRWSFVFFVVALVVVGGLLVVQASNILPWTVTPELSTLFGCMFIGAAVYFAYGVIESRWENAGGQLAGFLAYDIVLIVPFLTRLPMVDESLRLSLVVYTAVVTVSAVLAVYYLFIRPGTRMWPRPSGVVRPASAPAAEVPQVDATVVGVDVEALAAQEADERHPQALRGLDREV